jgi:hypothetical protein
MMKNKISISILLSVVVILASSCGKPDSPPVAVEKSDINESNPVEPQPIILDGPCNNIFYPLALDNQWIYQIQIEGEGEQPEISELGLTVSEVNESSAVLAALDYDTGIVTQSTAECEDGSILNFPMTQMNLVFGVAAVDMQLQYNSGVFMPSHTDFEAENWTNTWETDFTASGVISGTYDDEIVTIDLSESPVKMSWQVIEKDVTIQVPAGSFDNVVLIKRKLTFEVTSFKTTIEGEEIDISTTLILNSNMWYLPYVGLLKQEIDSATINLYGINFPVESIGKIELKSSNTIK